MAVLQPVIQAAWLESGPRQVTMWTVVVGGRRRKWAFDDCDNALVHRYTRPRSVMC